MITIHTFDAADQRARFTWCGRSYRAAEIRRDDNHGLSVWAARVTRAGADFKSGEGTWLTLRNSLERFPDNGGTDLAAYVREIANAIDHPADAPVCLPGDHDRSVGDLTEEEQPRDEHGDMLCNDCGEPAFYCRNTGWYHHVDPDAEPCFLAADHAPTGRAS